LKSPKKSPLKSTVSSTNIANPISPKKGNYGDRFIPSRNGHQIIQRALFPTEPKESTYNVVLKNELLGSQENFTPKNGNKNGGSLCNVFKYKTGNQTERLDSPFSLTPISDEGQKLLSSPRKPPRKIPKTPFRVLEAPAIQDDLYLNLVDWSSLNVLAVGLSNCVYLWNAGTSQVTKLCEVEESDSITAVSWIQRGTHLAVGTNRGMAQIWDVSHGKRVRDMGGHKQRVGALSWNAHILTSGSRDRVVYHRDVRLGQDFTTKLIGHKQEVCGLKWSYDGQYLASGGNDNMLFLWDIASTNPLQKFQEHIAAVKAIAWSPHQRGLLASGGGTADRRIRFWNTVSPLSLHSIDTGSQVCNLGWSKNVNELVSTHGYSQNQVVVWSYPSMTQVATLTGHSFRVLYLSLSPDGQTVVTGAGDETLRFWNIFPSAKGNGSSGKSSSSLQLKNDIR